MAIISFETFKDRICQRVSEIIHDPELFPDMKDPEVTLRKVNKGNEVYLTGLTIATKENNVSAGPTIYLEQYYDEIQSGKPFETVVHEIAEAASEAIREARKYNYEELEGIFRDDHEKLYANVYPVLVSAERNAAWANTMPHRMHADLMEILEYRVTKPDKDGRYCSVKLYDSTVESFGLDTDRLFECALENMRNNDPPFFMEMYSYMSQTFFATPDQRKQNNAEMVDELIPGTLYIASTSGKVNGAACLVDDQFINDLSDRYGDFYMLPSSVHEILIIKPTPETRLSDLREMVYTINRTEVSPTEVLSDNVYEVRNGKLEIAKTADELKLESATKSGMEEQMAAPKKPKRHAR